MNAAQDASSRPQVATILRVSGTVLAEFVILSHGWPRALLLIVAGILTALSAPPLFILPALFVGLPVLVWALDGAERYQGFWSRLFGPAFRIGFWFGLGYFASSLHWIGFAFLVDGGWLLALMPVAVLALAAVLALFWGIGVAVAHLMWSEGMARLFSLSACLALAEFARGHLFTGLPFDLVGYALTANVEMMQAASLVGAYGLTFAAILIGAVPAVIWPSGERSLPMRLLPAAAAVGLLILQYGWGFYRVSSTQVELRQDMVVRLVQPAVPQDLKWQAFARDKIVGDLLDLSASRTSPTDPGLDGVTHLIWPETALPFILADGPEYLAQIASALPDGLILLTGAPRKELEEGSVDFGRLYNSILAISSDGEVISSYDKSHLVPFGEYLPFQEQLRQFGLKQFVAGDDGWTAGETRRVMALPATPPIMPLICYEAAFSGDLGAATREAELIVVATNDAWFDGSIGLEKNFHHARLRAVEEGLPLIRSANSGVSAVIDPLGRIGARLNEREVGAINAVPALAFPPTFFARYGDMPFLALCGFALGVSLIGRIKNRRACRALL